MMNAKGGPDWFEKTLWIIAIGCWLVGLGWDVVGDTPPMVVVMAIIVSAMAANNWLWRQMRNRNR